MRHRILVIDDDATARAAIYKKLQDACSTEPLSHDFAIDFVYAQNFWTLQMLLSEGMFSAVIVDIVLDRWTRSPTDSSKVHATEVLKLIPDDIPIALLSSEWLSPQVKELFRQWPQKNCRMFIHWNDLASEDDSGRTAHTLLMLKVAIEEYAKIDYSNSIGPGDPIRIVQFSDMQFGGYDEWKVGGDVTHYASTVRRVFGGEPSFIAITGDITEHGLPSEFAAAQAWLQEFVSHFKWKLPSPRVLLVPGNHDVCLPLAGSAELQLQEAAKSIDRRKKDPTAKREFSVDFRSSGARDEDLLDMAFRPYNEFSAAVSRAIPLAIEDEPEARLESRNSFAWIEPRFRHLGIAFFGLNTARPLHPRSVPDRRVSKVAIKSLTKACTNLEEQMGEKLLFVGMTHHAPLGERGERAIENPESLGPFFSDVPGIGLWLHGHWHERTLYYSSEPNGRCVVISGAPSPTLAESKRPKDSPRGFSMIELTRLNGKIVGCEGWPIEWRGDRLVSLREISGKYQTNADGRFIPSVSVGRS